MFSTPRLGVPDMAGGHSLGIPPENRGVVLSERSKSKGDAGGALGLPGAPRDLWDRRRHGSVSTYFFGSSAAKATQ